MVVTLEFKQGGKLLERKEFRADISQLVVGRSASMGGVVIPNDKEQSREVSRRHCAFKIAPPEVFVYDTGSAHGTYVNGVEIGRRPRDMSAEQSWEIAWNIKNNPVALKCGDVVTLPSGIEISVSVDSAGGETQPNLVNVCIHCAKRFAPDGIPYKIKFCYSCMYDEAVAKIYWGSEANKVEFTPSLPAGYKLVKELGRGRRGTSITHLVENIKTGEQKVLKQIIPSGSGKDTLIKDLFVREIYTTDALSKSLEKRVKDNGNSNIVKMLGDGVLPNGNDYMFLEYCSGGTLHNYLNEQFFKKGKVVDVKTALHITNQILDALEFIHTADAVGVYRNNRQFSVKGLVHRNIKPSSIFLDAQNNIKVGGFSLTKSYELDARKAGFTSVGVREGAFSFIPLVQFQAYDISKPQVDVWAAVAVLYYMLTGFAPRKPSANPNVEESNMREAAKTINIRQLNESIPEPLANLIDKALDDSVADANMPGKRVPKYTLEFSDVGSFRTLLNYTINNL